MSTQIDFERARPAEFSLDQLQSSVRSTDAACDVPEAMRIGCAPLIYLSMGSLGSADVELMRILIDELGEESRRVIVSKGPQGEEIELATI